MVPDPGERLEVHRLLSLAAIERAGDGGRVDAWGEPMAGVAIWLHRPPVTQADSPSPSDVMNGEIRQRLGPRGLARAQAFGNAMRELRARVRPDRHIYLDSIGVLAEHRRQGIATQLLDAGHAWADAAGLPCALDALTDANVAFYRNRGYAVVSVAPVPGADYRITAMRRPRPAAS